MAYSWCDVVLQFVQPIRMACIVPSPVPVHKMPPVSLMMDNVIAQMDGEANIAQKVSSVKVVTQLRNQFLLYLHEATMSCHISVNGIKWNHYYYIIIN